MEWPNEQSFAGGVPSPHRNSPRIETNAVVDFAGLSEVLLEQRIVNISLGGLALRAPVDEPVGSKVSLTVHFPDLGESIETGGEVVWVSDKPHREIGVRFLELDRGARETLRRFLYTLEKTA